MIRRILFASLIAALVCPGASPAAMQGLTPETAFGAAVPWGAQPSGVVWAPDAGSFLYELPSQDPFEALPTRQYDLHSGQSRIVIDPQKYGTHAKTASGLAWSPDGKRLAFGESGTLYVRDMSTNIDRVVEKGASDAQWSPRGDAIAFVHDADLYVAYLEPALRVTRLTTGGKENEILNGGLDWVYPEELRTQHGFAWSPDGSAIAYMQMDERPVTPFPIVDFMPFDNTINHERYPLAGEKNPRVTLHVRDLDGSSDRVVYDAGAHDEYLSLFGWKPNSQTLIAEVLDRHQQHLRVMSWAKAGEPSITLYEQSDPKWVNDIPLPTWTADGASLWMLDRDGTEGLYLRSASGDFKRLTGNYRAMALQAFDAKNDVAYVSAAYPTRRDRSLLAVTLDGKAPQNLTPAAGTHQTSVAPNGSYFVDTHSTLNDPPQTDLVETAGDTVHSTLAASSESLRSQLLPVEMLSVDSSYGKLDAWMIKPPNFDPNRKYPVVIYVYGGPATPTTQNAFGAQTELYHQLLAQRGFIVFSMDGPASQVDSDANVHLLYHNFGPGSLLGQKTAVSYLHSLPYVDPGRIGIWGWSFGGYETTYALTHTDLFKAGAAVAPVTDWHLYDSIYTERYMGLPNEDPKAYDASSVLPAAGDLHGELLISHGTSDDNVHMANTISLLQKFIDADKVDVDFYVYPQRTHSIAGVPQRRHLYEHMLDWWTQHL